MAPFRTVPPLDADALRARAFEAAPWPLLVLRADGTVAASNDAARMLFGADLARRGRPLSEVEGGGAALAGLVAKAAETGAPVSRDGLELSPAPRATVEVEAVATPFGAREVVLTLRPLAGKDEVEGAGLSAAAGLGRTLAHEIKNPLLGIRGAAQLLAGEGENAELAAVIVAEVDRVRRLVDRVEALSDVRAPTRRPVNVHALLDRVRRLAESGAAPPVRFRERFDPSLPEIEADEDQIVQVLLNLAKNAAEAAEGRADGQGEVTLATAYRHGGRVRHGGGWRPAPIEIRVEDNGPGVDPALRARLFDAFVTTKPHGQGLGLAIAAKLAADHGGALEHLHEHDRTVFRLLLPKASGAAA